MIRKFLLPLLAAAGAVLALFTVMRGAKPVPVAPPVAEASRPPFEAYVAGVGIIEANTENIAIGTPVGNVVTDVSVKVGDFVRAGQPLFKLRDSVTRAELGVRRATVAAAEATLERLRRTPRPEDVPPAEARVREAEAAIEDAKSLLRLWESVTDKRAVSEETLERRRYAVMTAAARLEEAKAELERLKAGAWKEDIAVAEAQVASAKAEVELAEAELDRRTIRAPVDGQLLQVKVRPGEYAQPGPLATPLMLLGGVDPLYLRVDVDENDAWRIRPGAPAQGFVRGNPELAAPLEFVRVEPYVVPKRSLTGDSTERVDTRVLQILFKFHRGELPVYVGQQMDVFIEAAPIQTPSLPTSEEPTRAEGSLR